MTKTTTPGHPYPATNNDSNGSLPSTAAPGSRGVRGSLAQGLAEAVTPDKVKELVDAALTATKTSWETVTCKHCRKAAKYPIELRDPATAAKVLQILADQGLGRPQFEAAVPVPHDKPVWEMSPDERAAYKAELFARLSDAGQLPLAAGPYETPRAGASPPRGFD